MNRVTQKDYNFLQIYQYVKNPSENTDIPRLITFIQLFRSKLSIRWLDLFSEEDPIEILANVWIVLFQLSAHDDATVRINIYNAIGALLFSLLPFTPINLMKSFARATQVYKETSKASICIVSSFLYICNFVSPSDLDNFLTMAPVIPHFGADVSGFIQHIPKFVKLMKPLDVQFHQVFLRSLLSSFGRKPNHDFVKSVVLLISLNPDVLIKDLMEFTIANSLNQTILALGPQILKNDKIFSLLSDSYISHFMEESLQVISNTDCILSDFEQACGTLSVLGNRFNDEKLQNLKDRIQNQILLDDKTGLKNYPKHFQRLLLQLPTNDISALKIDPNDSNSIKCAKINALVNFARKAENSEVVVDILSSIDHELLEGDLLTTLIAALKMLVPILIPEQNRFDDNLHIKHEKFSKMIRAIIIKRGQTWLQNNANLKLLLTIGPDLGNRLIPDFEQIAMPLILDFSMSLQIELSEVALTALGEFLTLANVENVKSFLWSVNYFDPQLSLRFVRILNTICDSLGSHAVTEFVGLAGELVVFYSEEPDIAGSAFEFINKCKSFENPPSSVITACIDWITRLFYSVTQLSSKVQSPLKNEPLTPLISTVETDVVASDLLDIRSHFLSLYHCYHFFISVKGVLSPFCVLFSKELIRLFPERIIPFEMTIPKANLAEFPELPIIISLILKSESSLDTAASCCDFLAKFGSQELNKPLKDVVLFFVKHPKVLDGDILYRFYNFLIHVNPNEETELINIITNKLDTINQALFELNAEKFSTEQFNEFKVKVKFPNWPTPILNFFKDNQETITLDENDFDALDFDHFSFYFNNQDWFKVDSNLYHQYIKNHQHFFKKLNDCCVPRTFEYKPIGENLPKIPTMLPQFVNNTITVYSDPLLHSFYQFSNYRITQESFDVTFNKIVSPKTALSAIQYALKYHLKVSDDQMINSITNIQLQETFSPSDGDFEELLVLISKNISKEKVPQFESVLKSQNESFGKSLKLFYDPDSSLNEIIATKFSDEMAIKSKNLKFLSQTLSKSPRFNIDNLCSLIQNKILTSIVSYETILEIESCKKLILLLRIINQVLSLYKRQLQPDFLNEINQALLLLQSSEFSIVYSELSRIFSVLFEFFESKELINFCESFDKIVKTTSVFLVAQSVASFRYPEWYSSGRIQKTPLNDQLLFTELPSMRMHAIIALDHLLNCRSFWPLIIQIISNVFNTFQDFSATPIFDHLLANFSSLLAANVNFQIIRPFFAQRILPFLFVSPNSPNFQVYAESASIAIQQIGPPLPHFYKYIDAVIQTRPLVHNAAHYYREFVRWLLKHERDKVRQCDILLEEFSVVQRIYELDPSPSNAEGLIEALKQSNQEGMNVTIILFGKLTMLQIPLLQMVVLVHKYVKSADEEETKRCMEIFESLADSYSPEVSKALRSVLNGKPLDGLV